MDGRVSDGRILPPGCCANKDHHFIICYPYTTVIMDNETIWKNYDYRSFLTSIRSSPWCTHDRNEPPPAAAAAAALPMKTASFFLRRTKAENILHDDSGKPEICGLRLIVGFCSWLTAGFFRGDTSISRLDLTWLDLTWLYAEYIYSFHQSPKLSLVLTCGHFVIQ